MLLLFILSSSIYSATHFCIHYHPPLCILLYYYYHYRFFLRTEDDLNLSLFHIFIYLTHAHDAVVNVYFFLHCCSLSLSCAACRFDLYLFRFVQGRRRNTTRQRSAWINFFIFSSMHVYVLPLTNTRFFLLYILSIFPFFTPLCNRQMKVKKKTRECIEYIRRFKDDEAKRHQDSSATFSFVSPFSFFSYLSIFCRSFFSY